MWPVSPSLHVAAQRGAPIRVSVHGLSCFVTAGRFFARVRQLAAILAGLSMACCGASRPSSKIGEGGAVVQTGLLRELTERYASCRSYEDTGTAVITIRTEGGVATNTFRVTFQTAFDRPSDGFRFEFTETGLSTLPPHGGVIWRGMPGLARTWLWSSPKIREEGLSTAIQNFSGTSQETSRNVPSLLLGSTTSPFHDWTFQPDGDEVVDGFACVRLRARRDDDTVVLWVSTHDHVLRRVFTHDHEQASPEDIRRAMELMPPGLSDEVRARFASMATRPFVYEKTIQYTPVFDRPIDHARFEFTPPPHAP